MNEALISITVFGAGMALVTAPFWVPMAWEAARRYVGSDARNRRDVHHFNDIRVNMVCALLREGQGWVFDKYYANHAGIGVSIWIANDIYGCGVRFDGRTASPSEGGLTRFQRAKIMRAYRSRGEAAKEAARHLEQFMERVRRNQEEAA